MSAFDPNRGARRRSVNRRKRPVLHFWFWAVAITIAVSLMAWVADNQPAPPQGTWCGEHLCTHQERAVFK